MHSHMPHSDIFQCFDLIYCFRATKDIFEERDQHTIKTGGWRVRGVEGEKVEIYTWKLKYLLGNRGQSEHTLIKPSTSVPQLPPQISLAC